MVKTHLRRGILLSLFPAISLVLVAWRPALLDYVAVKQLAVLCAGYAIALVIYGLIRMRPAVEADALACAVHEVEKDLTRERLQLQTKIDFLSAEREISLVLNEDVDFQVILEKVLNITNVALGGRPDDQIEIYLREAEDNPPVLRAARRLGRTTFANRGRPPTDPLVTASLRHGRLICSAENGHLDVVSPLSFDKQLMGVMRVRTRLEGEPSEKSEHANRLSQHVDELSRFIALAIKTPGLYQRAVEDGLTGLATKRHFLTARSRPVPETGQPTHLTARRPRTLRRVPYRIGIAALHLAH